MRRILVLTLTVIGMMAPVALAQQTYSNEKVEYTFEHGKEVGGAERKHEDLFALEVAFKF